MKNLFVLAFLFSTSSFAAAPLPDCWTTDGREVGKNAEDHLIADGEWLVTADPKIITKDELIWLFDTLNQRNLRPTLSLVRPNYIILGAKAVEEGTEIPRDELQRKANAQMAAVAALAAVNSVECNRIEGPLF